MDDCVIDGSTAADAVSGINKTESAVSFQKFVYELFEKNGILNDLRAYLRGHIIDVLQNAQTGESPSCQKHFTQRLELTYQALNMLVAEYLLRLEFSYSLSVFVSEIPLANMVISFAKKLLLINNGNFESLKFKENDVWSILNYLGVKCDSAHASNIIKIYNSKNNVPLLLCILQCLPMYQKDISDQENLSSPSLSSSIKSLDNLEMSNNNCTTTKVLSGQEKCRHYAFCQTCQGKMEMVRQKYKDKKYNLTKELKLSDYNVLNIEMFMRNIGTMEKSLIDEMFQQLKSVYEAEVEMTKLHEQKKIKRSLANHALQLQKRRNEMEESFRTREAELERNVQEKKKFLWGLARALRDQHSQMARAMHAIRCETERLSAKEKNLNTQLLEAEEILRKRGEDMRKQISDELIVLEGHLESMKRERNSIKKERTELESLKAACKNSSVIQVDDSRKDELVSHYDVLKDELAILKKYLETTKLEPKRVIEKSTITDLNDVTAKVSVLNNEQQAERSALRNDSDDRIRTTNKVVNDWKKQKNVNFCTLKVDELYREHSRSSVSSDAIDVSVHTTGSRDLDRLRDENERLKTFARQQREHIDELTSHQAQLRAQLTVARFSNDGGNLSRPRTAPSHPAAPTLHRMNLSASSYAVGWRKGGGEEINTYWRAQPQVVLPGDAVPFIGPLRGRRADSRRYLINQWRGLRRRTSPPGGVGKLRAPACSKRDSAMSEAAGPSVSSYATVTPIRDEATRQMNETFIFQNIPRERPKTSVTAHSQHPRDKSPKSVLREAKEKLRNHPRSTAPGRDKSPGAVLREAKLRLRKLEIEAEAVERSYMDFRRRHSADRQARDSVRGQLELGQLDVKSLSHHITQESYYRAKKSPCHYLSHFEYPANKDFDKYLRTYKKNTENSSIHFNRTSVTDNRPNANEITKVEAEMKETLEICDNFLETPLTEFRKLYLSGKYVSNKQRINDEPQEAEDDIENNIHESLQSRRNLLKEKVKIKQNEYEILKDNINKIYNVKEQNEIGQTKESDLPIDDKMHDQKINDNTREEEMEQITESKDQNENKHIMESELTTHKGDGKNEETEDKVIIAEIEHSIKRQPENTEDLHQELVIVVESSIDTKEISEDESQHKISTQMTIIVSPKITNPIPDPHSIRSISPEEVAELTRNDALDAIFRANASKMHSSVEMELNLSNDIEDSLSEHDKEDYPDDFSADVDNYNSRSEYIENLSPISLPKTPEDDNFWDN